MRYTGLWAGLLMVFLGGCSLICDTDELDRPSSTPSSIDAGDTKGAEDCSNILNCGECRKGARSLSGDFCECAFDTGANCDDNDPTTKNDTCQSQGICKGTKIVCPADSTDRCGMKYVPNGKDCTEIYPGNDTTCSSALSCAIGLCNGSGTCGGDYFKDKDTQGNYNPISRKGDRYLWTTYSGVDVVIDSHNDCRMWQRTVDKPCNGGYCTLVQSRDYCSKLTGEGWRVPTRTELESLFAARSCNSCYPNIDTVAFSQMKSTTHDWDWFWTSDCYDDLCNATKGAEGQVWTAVFFTGTTCREGVTYMHPVRCVR